MTWTEAHVTIDDGTTVYPCQIAPEDWNGYARPRFTREIMNRIIEDWHAAHQRYAAEGHPDWIWDLAWNGDAVEVRDCTWSGVDENDDPVYDIETLQPGEDGFYYFGGGILAWEIAKRPAARP